MAPNPYARYKPEKQGWEWSVLEFVLFASAASLLGAAVYWYMS